MRLTRMSIGVVLGLFATGCSETDSVTEAYGLLCTPGSPAACKCAEGYTSGRSTCNAAGTAYAGCDCSMSVLETSMAGSAAAPDDPVAPLTGSPAVPENTAPEPVEPIMMGTPIMMEVAPPEMPEMPEMPVIEEPEVPEPVVEEPEEEPETPETPAAVGDGSEVPATPACADAADWDPEATAFEDQVLELTNEARAEGANCGGVQMDPVGPLTTSPELRCSARLHSKDMADLGYFSHTSQDGREVPQRIAAAGYSGRGYGENIAQGQRTPDQVVTGWLGSPGHCRNMMTGSFTEIGIGFYEGESTGPFGVPSMYWTQNFGVPGGGGFGRQ